jgi:anaerobic ribonucleoside-triphosphate reductase
MRKIIMNQAGDIRDDIDRFLDVLQTTEELEEYRVKLINYINERCKKIAEETGFEFTYSK